MRGALILAIVLIGLICALRSRFAGLLLYLWFALFRPQEWAWGSLTAFRLSFIVGLVLVVPALCTGVWPNVTHPLTLGTAIFVLIAVSAQLDAADRATGWESIELLATSVVIALLMVRLVDSRKRYLAVLAVIAGSLAFHAAKYGVGYLLRGGAQFSVGIGGMFGGNNEFGVAVARILPLLVAVVQNVPAWPIGLGFLAAVPASMIGIVSTFSRASFLALATAVLLFVLLQRRRLLAMTGLAVAAGIGLLVVPVPTSYVDRLETIRTYEEIDEDSAMSRLHFWRVAVDMAAANPLGVGLNNYEANFNRYDFLDGRYGTDRDVHSTHFQVLAEMGYPGFVVYAGLVIGSLVIAFRIRRRARAPGLEAANRRFLLTNSNALIISVGAFLVGGSFNSLLLNDLNWYTIGLIAALDRISRRMVEDAQLPAESPALAA